MAFFETLEQFQNWHMRSWRLDALDRVGRFGSGSYSFVGVPGLASWTASSARDS
jgi:antibiotic biosynthesis monooxygenase (ABM) superfamily enzyme